MTSALTDFNRYVLVGCGGVGTHLDAFFRYLAYKRPGTEVVLIDGDFFEEKNHQRQNFENQFQNKAIDRAESLTKMFPSLKVSAVPVYVTKENVAELISEQSVVFMAVDNHPSRTLISEHMSTLEDAILISGGNDYSDGNVQIHARMDGENITPPITYLHPEINEKNGKHPADLSCMEAAEAGSPQLVLANNMVASLMAGTYWRFEQAAEKAAAAGKSLDFPEPESYFDLTTGAVRPVKRIMKKETMHGAGSENREVNIDKRGASGRAEAASGN